MSKTTDHRQRRRGAPSRRAVLAGAGAAGFALAAGPRAFAEDDPALFSGNPFRDRFQSFRQTFRIEPDREEANRIVAAIIRDRPLRAGLVELTAPDIAEDGNVVPVGFAVACAMAGDDYPAAVHVIAMDNPFPEIAKYHFTPACGEAQVSFRCRMRASSDLVVIAEMADGTVGMATRWVSVTLGACS
ncbi:MAG TPA: thiosulfate oxidation carrier protein SoxY [Alphaproteobacteria bacterium]